MFSHFIQTLGFAFGITAPIFLLVFLGTLLKKIKLIDEQFANQASKLIFTIALPSLLFFSIAQTDLYKVFNGPMIAIAIGGTFLVFLLSSLLARYLVKQPRDRGVFVQAAFRGNLAIVGLAFCDLAYGDLGIAKASIIISFLTLFYNVLSIYTLSASLSVKGKKWSSVFINMLKNPLIIAIGLGIVVSLLNISLPMLAIKTGSYLSTMTLPLALLCIGATVSVGELKKSSTVSMIAVAIKLVLVPVIIVYAAYLWGFEAIDLGVLFFMVSSPTAAVSYVMVQAMGGNGKLAANMIAISTLLSLFTVSIGLSLLRFNGLV